MTDPKPMTDTGSEATDFERELLHAAQGVGLSASEKAAIWANVAAQCLPLSAAGVSTYGSAASGTAASGAVASKAALGLSPGVKAALLALGVGGLGGGGFWLNHAASSVRPAATAATPTHVAAAPSALLIAEHEPVTSEPSPTSEAPAANIREAVPSVSNETKTPDKSALRDESAAVLEIRRTLRGGNAPGALRLLEQARQRFRRGALSQEREALTIEALAKSGAGAAAARKARDFLSAYPKSPYASDVRSFTGQ